MVLEFFGSGFRLARRVYYLAAVPFLVDLLFLTGRVLSISFANMIRYGVKFSLPVHFPSLTDVYQFPTSGGIQVGFPAGNGTFLGLLLAVLSIVLTAFLGAGYVGVLNASRLGQPSSFVWLASKYFLRFLIYGLFIVAAIFVDALLILATPPIGLLFVLLFFVFYYFVFLTPFAIVVDGVGFAEALGKSINLSLTVSSKTVPYVVLFAVATAVVSIPVYAFMNGGFLGFLVVDAGYAFVGTGLVASTLYLYVNLTPTRSRD